LTANLPEYPPLKKAADQASAKAQRKFLWLNRIQLILLTTVAFGSGLSLSIPAHQRVEAWAICVIMFATLGFSGALRIGKFDDRWFRCRAYAENLKSIVWQFVMSNDDASDTNATRYLDELNRLRERLPDLQREFVCFGNSGHLITAWMQTFHGLPVETKALHYRELRVEDQITWYSNKAKLNSEMEDSWFWTVFIIEFAAVACSAFQSWQLMKFNPVGGIAAVGTALIAWSQIKRYSDLGTSYSIAAADLRGISEVHKTVTSQAELDLMVQEVEKAVSREHSIWLARRVITVC
jgi:hypothetical protein